MNCLSSLLILAAFPHSHCLSCGHIPVTVIWEIPVACSDVPARQEAPAAGIKNTLKMIETFLLLNCDRGKPKPLHGACNNRETFQQHFTLSCQESSAGKKYKLGKNKEKVETGKAWLLVAQKRNCFIWWAEIQGKLRLLWALQTRQSSFTEAPGPSGASGWVSWGSKGQGQKILQENALEKKCLQSR